MPCRRLSLRPARLSDGADAGIPAEDAPLFRAIRRDSVLSQVKLIAEPQDIGPGGYQVGNFPPLFAEWNDHFRDSARRFWLQQNVSLGDFAQRFAASSDLFARDGKPPSATVNLVTAHDGFTLRDCVCFNQKHNEANGEENRDGTNNNYSNNHGIEGLEANFAVRLNGGAPARMRAADDAVAGSGDANAAGGR